MANSPHMPASMPIAQQRVVRGDAVLRLPGKTSGPDLPRFSHDGVLSAVTSSPAHPMDGDMNLVEAIVVMRIASADIVFDILVNESVVETVNCTALYIERYDIVVPVLLNDTVAIDITDVDSGLAEKLTIVLRPFTSPAFPI